ncbi:SWI/SNF-related matrix-associated actin-dependent regulator of chromatin subfamily B member 1 [Nymphon striatum]|nr:SWI/SNF-related matrix-associated actin-dependent regulator of chromatin subfamily B member 1 [Nymphon striatum]
MTAVTEIPSQGSAAGLYAIILPDGVVCSLRHFYIYLRRNVVGKYLGMLHGAVYKKFPTLWRRMVTLEERNKISNMEGIGPSSLSTTITLLKVTDVEELFGGNNDKCEASNSDDAKRATAMNAKRARTINAKRSRILFPQNPYLPEPKPKRNNWIPTVSNSTVSCSTPINKNRISHKKMRTIPYSNEYLKLYEERMKNAPNAISRFCDSEYGKIERLLLVKWIRSVEERDSSKSLQIKFSFSIPNEEALQAVKDLNKPIISMGSGTGYWEHLLENSGCDIICFDKNNLYPSEMQYRHIQTGEPTVLKNFKKRALFLSWPDADETSTFSMECLSEYQGDIIIHVGELFGSTQFVNPWGQSTTREFQLALVKNFRKVGNYLGMLHGALYKKFPALWRRMVTLEERKKIANMEGIGPSSLSTTITLLKVTEVEELFGGNNDKCEASNIDECEASNSDECEASNSDECEASKNDKCEEEPYSIPTEPLSAREPTPKRNNWIPTVSNSTVSCSTPINKNRISHKKMRTIPYSNEYLKLYEERMKNAPNAISRFCDSEYGKIERLLLVKWIRSVEERDSSKSLQIKFSFSIPNEEALQAVKDLNKPIISMGSGTGYWEHLLENSGCDIICFDKNNLYPSEMQYRHIQTGEPTVLKNFKKRVLFLSWPDADETSTFSMECLSEYQGDIIIHVGELFGSTQFVNPWGQSTTHEFQLALVKKFRKVKEIKLPNWPGHLDSLTIWNRIGEPVQCDRALFCYLKDY